MAARDRMRAHGPAIANANATNDILLRSRLRHYARADRAIQDARLAALEREWDLERALETNAAVAGLAGISLGLVRGGPWAWMPAAVLGFLLQHGLQGWCPPLPLLRRLGYRTRREIDEEIYGLRLLRGDFAGIPAPDQAAPETRAFRTWEALRRRRDEQGSEAEAAQPPGETRPPHLLRLHALRQRRRAASLSPSDARAENFLAQVRSRRQPEREEELDVVLRSVLAHLRWRLPPSEAATLFSHLPRAIARSAAAEPPHGYALGNPPKSTIDADAFFQEISSETGLRRHEVQQATAAVFASMKRQLPGSQNRAMGAMLPRELKRVWLQA